ncbi:MAG: S41 family peptidase, partial [Oscillospiraceae bacterium]
MRKKITFSAALSAIFVAITVTFCLTMILSSRLFETKVSNVNEKEAMYSKLAEVDQIVRQHFYTKLDDAKLYDGLAGGYLSSLGDTDAKYYTAAEVNALQNLSKGKLVGIGVEISKDRESGYGKIVKVHGDSPANIAEIVKDDLIIAINDVDVFTLTSAQIRDMLIGEEGTAVKLKYRHEGEEKETELMYKVYDMPSIAYSLEETVGYIKAGRFTVKTASEMEYAVKSLISQGATSFVLDLRFNKSKEFEYAAAVADMFVKEGTTMFAQYADESKKVLFTSDKECVTQPITVIVNNQTGYAGEMFAVILKDMSGAKFVGTQTMGKCTIQTLYRMTDGSGLEFTTARLVPVTTPDYHGVGVMPDYEKLLDADQELNFYDL